MPCLLPLLLASARCQLCMSTKGLHPGHQLSASIVCCPIPCRSSAKTPAGHMLTRVFEVSRPGATGQEGGSAAPSEARLRPMSITLRPKGELTDTTVTAGGRAGRQQQRGCASRVARLLAALITTCQPARVPFPHRWRGGWPCRQLLAAEQEPAISENGGRLRGSSPPVEERVPPMGIVLRRIQSRGSRSGWLTSLPGCSRGTSSSVR